MKEAAASPITHSLVWFSIWLCALAAMLHDNPAPAEGAPQCIKVSRTGTTDVYLCTTQWGKQYYCYISQGGIVSCDQ